jgi:hypothetical protein
MRPVYDAGLRCAGIGILVTMALLVLALLAFPPQDPPAKETASGFIFIRPRGWNRQEIPNQNMVALMPPGPTAQQCSLFIFAGQNGDLNELVYHDKLFQSVTQGSRVDGKINRAYRGGWQYSHAKILNAQHQNQWLVLYTTKVGTRMEGIFFIAATEEILKAHRFDVERMITNIEFPGAKPPPAGGPDWTPAPVPGKDKDIRILGAWTVARLEMVFSADPKAGGLQQQHTVKTVALFANQVALKVDARQTGLIDSTWLAEGLATVDVSDPAALAGRRQFGRWSEADGTLKIQWNEGPEDSVVREKENLRGGGILWSAIKPLDGLRLDATWQRPNDFGLPGMLALHPDGSFQSDQVNETMGGKLVNRKFPEMGSGTYEFRKWSLVLRFDTGFVQSIQVGFDAEDPSSARSIFINGTSFERVKAPAAAPK